MPSFIILGAGFAGLGFAMQLQRSGHRDFVILEKGERIGGTWRDNVYPGSGCDIPSHLYCFSFEPNPDWTRKFANQREILAYLERCAEKYQLGPHLRLGVEVARAAWVGGAWEVTTTGGDTLRADFLISALGQLNRPQLPDIEGRERFEGHAFHSAHWDRSLDLAGRRVAVIGNGASAIQLVPEIAPLVNTLTVFQRSPAWIVPKPDRRYHEVERWLFRRVPWLMRAHRYAIYWQLEGRFVGFAKGSLGNRIAGRMAQKQLDTVADRELRARLAPDYPVGCKRILISNDYYATLQLSHVELVTEPIARMEHDGPVTTDGRRHPVDAVIYATGFQSLDFLAPIDIVGRDGKRLDDRWREGAEAYLGMAVSGFPNLFILYGPNTNLGHNSIIFMLECQMRYILGCIEKMGGHRSIEVRHDALERFNASVQQDLDKTVWSAGCSNWYTTAAGKNTNNWGSYTAAYWWRTRRPDFSAYHLE